MLPASAFFGVAAYVTCSSMMLVANKVTLTLIPLPGAVFTFQLAFAVVSIYMMKTLCSLRVDDLTWFNIKLMFPYTISFAMSIYANGKSLEHSNVETVIVARSCAPLLISVIEWAVLNRQLPSWKSTGALLSILVAATGYVLADSQMKLVGLQAYTWVGIYLLLIVYNMVYGKSVTSKVSFASPVWGLTPWIIRARIDGSLGRGWGDGWGTETGNIRPYAILM
ncbi:unnamed protein product [Durusdinium trenchii]|uniref:Sugar phosphate transporter domain-containing protein n=1 Tax=Durusdinium trenchii TaxID=1381693 RepID=A0ABP0IH34_9DINO